jgi:hypothetical protein
MDLSYLLNPKKAKSAAHWFDGKDTLCRMLSTGGMNKSKMRAFSSDQGHEMCNMCGNVFNRLVNKEIGNIQNKSRNSMCGRGCGRINLHCPFHEKDQAKSLGARWDNDNRTWFIVDIEDITPFMRWIRARGDTSNQSQFS